MVADSTQFLIPGWTWLERTLGYDFVGLLEPIVVLSIFALAVHQAPVDDAAVWFIGPLVGLTRSIREFQQLELDAKQQERESFVGSFSIVPSSSWSDVEPAGKAP